ncbi:MAG: VWA domain-containing protein, partial [Alphaproteobacteria bacterium]
NAMAEVTRKMTALDVVLAIDMSGSMNSGVAGGKGSRIKAARKAATDLIKILFGKDSSKALLNIGLVPWNGKVNVTIDGTVFDPALTTTVEVPVYVNPEDPSPNPASPPPPNPQSQVFFANNSPVPLLEAPPPGWKGAVYNRFLDNGNPDDDADILYGPVNPLGADWVAWQPIGPEGEPVAGGAKCAISAGPECTPALRHGITPLQHKKKVIVNAVNALQYPAGVTNIPAGLGWAWRVLKPAAPFTEAVPDDLDYDRKQAIILLTDGENFGGSGDGYKTTFGLGADARPDMNERLLAVADNVKADGVIIYVIQLSNQGSKLRALLETVASGPASPYYYFAPDADALKRGFREIADHLLQLRLSK